MLMRSSIRLKFDPKADARKPLVSTTSQESNMPQSLTQQLSRVQQISALEKDWAQNPRWKGVKRGYSAADVVRLRGSLQPEYTLAQRGAELLWDRINGGAKKGHMNAFGAISAGDLESKRLDFRHVRLLHAVFSLQKENGTGASQPWMEF